MKQRDLYYLQGLADEGNVNFINLAQYGDYAVAESTNGFCYLQIAKKNNKRFTQEYFKFTGKGTQDEISLPAGYEIYDANGKEIASYQYSEPFDIKIGTQGEFKATFNREEMIFFLKYYLATYRKSDSDKYMLVFHRSDNCWKLRGYERKKIKLKDMAIVAGDTITDTTFRFAVNPYILRHIFKWFECDDVTMYFHNGNYTCNTPIFMRDNNKLAVLMPIARKK